MLPPACPPTLLPSDVYQGHICPCVTEEDQLSLALTSKSQLAFFHKLTLNLKGTIDPQQVNDLKAALLQNNEIHVFWILQTIDRSSLQASWESNVFNYFPQCRPTFCMPRGERGRAYLKSMGIENSLVIQKIKCGRLTVEDASQSYKLAMNEMEHAFEHGGNVLHNLAYENIPMTVAWLEELKMIRNQIMGNKGLQKYALLGELSWADAFKAIRVGKDLSQFNDPSIQEALDTGKMTASYCCSIGNICRKVLLRTCQSKNWELLAQLESTNWGLIGASSELEGIKNALNDDWVVDALVVGKIKLEELCEFPIYEVRLNSDYERISRNEILDNFPILLFNEYSVLCFAPVQQAIDRGQLTLSDLLTLTFEELNSIVPDFYKGTFFERVFDIVVPDLNIQNNIKEDCSIQ